MSRRILVVAKPWRGGLARYVCRALEAVVPGAVEWLPTHPLGTAERLRYVRDRGAWRRRLVTRIGATDWRAVLFINHLAAFAELSPRDNLVLWLTDGPRPHEDVLSPYGRVFVSDPGYGAEVEAALAPGRYGGVLPFAHDPTVHRPHPRSRPARGVCTIANRDPKRDAHLRPLLDAGMDATVYGNYFLRHRLSWRHPTRFRPPVRNAAMGRAYARHAASLNVHATIVREGTNMRSFECAGYGIPQVVEYRPGLERYFEPDVEIAVYHEPTEVVDAVRALLADPRRARNMAERARARVRAEHTYRQRVIRALGDLLPAAAAWH